MQGIKMTYTQQAEKNRLSLTLRELGINEETAFGYSGASSHQSAKLEKLLMHLVINTPTSQSHLGKKFCDYSKVNSNTTNNFLDQIFKGLKVQNAVYLFTSYTEKTKFKNDLHPVVLARKAELICLRCDNGTKVSLYMAVRNAIAHGNILEHNGFYILYSVSDSRNEFDSNLTFFLRIRKLENIKTFLTVLEQYQ